MERLNLKRLALLLFMALPLAAEGPQDLFKQGNAAYAQGKFDEAAKLYESAKQAGLNHWILNYNLGNAAYKSGQLGRAVLNYERAFQLNSSDRDLLYNLELATNKAGDPALPTSALPALLWRIFHLLSLNFLTLVVSLLVVGLSAWASLALLGKIAMPAERAMPLLFALFLTGAWLAGRVYLQERSRGVIVAREAEVRSGPNTSYPANFTVPEGHRVLELDEQEPVTGWVEIGVPEQGLKGWVPAESIESI